MPPITQQRPPALGGADQATRCGRSFLEVLLGLRQFHDVIGGVFGD